ncbi:MAG: OsmC family protein [Candidatus Heimdallarchaeota archaeon]|nr:OsmC family protein [Candidatus Heimdallarchaeota archaeon]MCK4878476.1 OsmC family protein [Candidatus Heimdallarchaeota archaeon]
MSKTDTFEYEIKLVKKDNYKFEVDFGEEIPKLLMDESTEVPGGEGKGPQASFLLAAAVGNCLSASFMFCLSKKKVNLVGLKTNVRFKRERNEQGFWRISKINADLFPEVEDKNDKDFERCVEIFKNYCIVSMSVEQGIDIEVTVK